MSRTGKRPVIIPDKVKVNVANNAVNVEGPQGKLSRPLNALTTVNVDKGQVIVTRKDDSLEAKAAHGLVRALIKNMIEGVSQGFTKILDIEGVGYRAEMKGSTLSMTLGFSHPVDFKVPDGIKIAVEKQTRITVSGPDREKVGQTTANIRGYKPPEPYKGKGIRYADEVIQRKVGKAAASGGAK
ncbi:50S ribosomal protein L6 [bacterium]|nr:50S ribosomal protein L6 [bacterium]